MDRENIKDVSVSIVKGEPYDLLAGRPKEELADVGYGVYISKRSGFGGGFIVTTNKCDQGVFVTPEVVDRIQEFIKLHTDGPPTE